MERSQARALLERTTSFEFRSGKVVVRDVRLLNAIAALRHGARRKPASTPHAASPMPPDHPPLG